MNALEVENLTVTASLRDAKVPVIRDVSFSVAPGRVLGLVGESGAGKSVIGRAIGQALAPGIAISGGTLRLLGEDLRAATPSRRRALLGREIAFVPQEPMTALNPVLTIGTQMHEHLRRLGLRGRGVRQARALELLDSVHLSNGRALLGRYPHQLSGGMCQRVLIAMAFASRPRLLVADEPTTALDVTIQARIVRLLAEMQRHDGTAVLFITHDLRLAARICDDIAVLYAGRMVEQGPAGPLLARPAHPYTRCLRLASPDMTGPRRALYALPEQMPGLSARAALSGCLFAPRCPVAEEDCRRIDPPAIPVTAGRLAACLHAAATSRIAAAREAADTTVAGETTLLRVSGLGRRFGTHWAVRGAGFTVAQGELVGLVGESGSGKSTVARLVMGLDRASAGTIELGGRDVTAARRADARYRVDWAQMVFQDPQSALNPRRRVADIVTQVMQAGRAHATRAQRLARAEELLAEVGLGPEIAQRTPAQLSGGQKQRVNIARALCAVPRLLVADEVVSGLDVSVQAQLLALLARLRRERGIALLLISHDLSVVRHLCDRVLVMTQGEIVEQGSVEQVFAAPAHAYTRRLLAAVPPDDPDLPWEAGPVLSAAAAALPRQAAEAPSR
jgi:peptide/nickel transport system ATP-binding protein